MSKGFGQFCFQLPLHRSRNFLEVPIHGFIISVHSFSTLRRLSSSQKQSFIISELLCTSSPPPHPALATFANCWKYLFKRKLMLLYFTVPCASSLNNAVIMLQHRCGQQQPFRKNSFYVLPVYLVLFHCSASIIFILYLEKRKSGLAEVAQYQMLRF